MSHLWKECNSHQLKNIRVLARSMKRRDEDASSTDLLTSQGPTCTSISEDVSGPSSAGQPCHGSTASSSTHWLSAPSHALAFSIEHLSHPWCQPGTQPILEINSLTSNSKTRATAIDHQQKKAKLWFEILSGCCRNTAEKVNFPSFSKETQRQHIKEH